MFAKHFLISLPLLLLSSLLSAQTYQEHIIDHGETLSAIARQYNTSVQTLMEVNRLNGATIYAGQALMVPATGQANARTTTRGREIRHTANLADLGLPEDPTPTASPASNRRVMGAPQPTRDPYYVSRAPSLAQQAEGVWMRTQHAMLGDYQRLRRQGPGYDGDGRMPSSPSDQAGNRTTQGGTRSPSNPNQRVGTASPTQTPRGERIIHRVSRDEDIFDIAERYGVEVGLIRQWNGDRPIYTGQKLVIYRDPTAPIIDPDETPLDQIKQGLEKQPDPVDPQGTNQTSAPNARVANPDSVAPPTETGTYDVFKWPDTKERFYLAHKHLPKGTKVKAMLPGDSGYLTLTVVAYTPSQNTDYSLSPAAAQVLRAAGVEDELTLLLPTR